MLKIVWQLHKRILIASFILVLTLMSFISINLEVERIKPTNKSFPTGLFLLPSTVPSLFILLFLILPLAIIFFWKIRRVS